MIVAQDFLDELRTAVHALLDKIQGEAPNQFGIIATDVPTAGGKTTVKLNWLGAPPMPRAFRGTLEFGKSFPHSYTVTIGEYAVAIAIDRDKLNYDDLGQVRLHITNFMSQTVKFKDKIVFEQLSNGFDTACFDAQYFYSASHSVGDAGTHDNLGTAALSYEDPAEYYVAWKTVNTAKDDAGEPMGLMPTHLVNHPSTRKEALHLLKAGQVSGTTNVLQGDVELVTSPYLSTETEWHLLAANAPVKPILLFIIQDFNSVMQDAETSDDMFYRHRAVVKVEGQMNAGFGDFRQAYASTGAA